MNARQHDLVIDNVRLEGRWIGPAADEAPTLVLLHEGLGCVGLWSEFPQKLAAATGCGVFAYSRAGYGKSDPVRLPRPLAYMHDEARDVLPKLLDRIGFRRGLLVGHSDGASIAAIYAGMFDDARLDGIVLIAPHVFTEDMGIASIAAAKQAYEHGDLKRRLARWHDHVDCAFYGWNGAWLDPDFRQWDLRNFLPSIRVPVRIVQGEADQYGTIAQVRAIAEGCAGPVDTVMLAGVGHSPHREAPDVAVEAVSRFVQAHAKLQKNAEPDRISLDNAK
ncbi:MAG: alpha/beta hydrolase [Hyphomicrobiales bacterium]|nr:alpha/beta hydrolase [Hyphomicrobiales bacterium]